jgi:hypothetical protein
MENSSILLMISIFSISCLVLFMYVSIERERYNRPLSSKSFWATALFFDITLFTSLIKLIFMKM